MGDFNLPEYEDTYKMILDAGYQSSCVMVHGKEWEKTFPSGIQAKYMDTDDADVLDYIFIKGDSLKVKSIQIAGNQCLKTDKTIYPSDHFAIIGDFIFQ